MDVQPSVLYVKSVQQNFSYENEEDRRLPVRDPESLMWFCLLKMDKRNFNVFESDNWQASPRYISEGVTLVSFRDLANHLNCLSDPANNSELQTALTTFEEIISALYYKKLADRFPWCLGKEEEFLFKLDTSADLLEENILPLMRNTCQVLHKHLGPKTFLLKKVGYEEKSVLSTLDPLLVAYAMILTSELHHTQAYKIFARHTNLTAMVDRFVVKMKTPIVIPLNLEQTSSLIQFAESDECKKLGSGGFGHVSLGHIEANNLWGLIPGNYAFKVSHSGMDESAYEAECLYLNMLRYRPIVKLFAYGSSSGGNILVLSYARNGSLDKYMKDFSADFGYPTLLKVFKEIAVATHLIHSHDDFNPIIHHDYKPSNVLLDQDMNAIITDFGLTKGEGEFAVVTHTIYAKPPKALFWHSDVLGTRHDIYALGMMLLEAVTRGRIDPVGPLRLDTYEKFKQETVSQTFEFDKVIKPTLKDTGCVEKHAREVVAIGIACLSCLEHSNSPLAHEIADRLQELIDQLPSSHQGSSTLV